MLGDDVRKGHKGGEVLGDSVTITLTPPPSHYPSNSYLFTSYPSKTGFGKYTRLGTCLSIGVYRTVLLFTVFY